MFVTSDIFDCQTIGRFRGLDWRENLLGGVDIQGTNWPGYQAAARFMIEAAKLCGVDHELRYAGYNLPERWRTRSIQPQSFPRLARGELRGANRASGILLRGERAAEGVRWGRVLFGGEAGSIHSLRSVTGPIPIPGPPWRFNANFVFPLGDDPNKMAGDLLALAVDILGAEYGYLYVRDALCGPDHYTHGMSTPLDYSALSDDDAVEVSEWADVVRDGRLWSGLWPLLRDLFQVNLLTGRHMAAPIAALGYLNEWIAAQPGRGRLDSIGEGRWLWTLTDAEMFKVRPILNVAGLLVSCRPRVYRDLPGGEV